MFAFILVGYFHAKFTEFCGIRPMDIVVYLALIVLGAVFLFSLFILIIICRRKCEYDKILFPPSLRFSKLLQDNMEEVELLESHVYRALDTHCVAILKLCHLLTEKVAGIIQQIKQQPTELNEFICKATVQIVPRFEALLQSMASKDVEIRVLEARVGALCSACWSLVVPLSLASPKDKNHLIEVVQEMDFHLTMLQMALNKANELKEEQYEEQVSRFQLASAASTSLQQNKQQIGLNLPLQRECEQQTNGHVSTEDANSRRAAQTTKESENKVVESHPTEETPADPAIT